MSSYRNHGAAPSPLVPGSMLRNNYLVEGARSDIRLHCEGGAAYDRHMRRLVKEGLMEITRSKMGCFSGANGRISRLETTDAGFKYLQENGIEYEMPERKSHTYETFGWYVGSECRSVLVDGVRQNVHRLIWQGHHTLPSEYSERITTARIVTQSFKSGSRAYHWNPIITCVSNFSDLAPAGILRKTGHGLVLERHLVLSLKLEREYAYNSLGLPDIVNDQLKQFRSLVGHEPHIVKINMGRYVDLFLTMRNAHDYTLARMLFTSAQPFDGYKE